MKKVCWPYFDPEFDKLPERLYGPPCRVSIDNESLDDCTVVKVDSVNKQSLLLEVVQILTDMNLTICKSYISSDAGWFMDVFHVKDENGNKLTDKNVINEIQRAIGSAKGSPNSSAKAAFADKTFEPETYRGEHTAIEMTGTDRPGLFSEISAALTDLHCNIVEAHAWSHNARLACVAYISDPSTDTPIEDPLRLASIEDHLTTVLRAADESPSETKANQTPRRSWEGTMTNVERRLHQLMLSVRDFEVAPSPSPSPSAAAAETAATFSPRTPFGLESEEDGIGNGRKTTSVRIESCEEKEYSIVSVECKDRPRLMFDTVCTLTDMQYKIFHASISSNHGDAFQEYFIRHVDGNTLHTESEKERIIKCLEAAIERRVCEGIKLELRAENRLGLLSDITRVLRENGLAVVRADVETQGEKAVNAFYVRDISGNKVDMEMVESMKKEMSPIALKVTNQTQSRPTSPDHQRSRLSFGDKLKSQFERLSHNFVKSSSNMYIYGRF